MGSAKVSTANPQSAMSETTDKRSLKTLFRSIIFLKEKKKEKNETKEIKKEKIIVEEKKVEKVEPVDPVAALREGLAKLGLQKNEESKANEEEATQQEDDLSNFTVKVVEDDRTSERNCSQSSEDSGFIEGKDTETDDKALFIKFSNLKVSDVKKIKPKNKLQNLFASRAPIRIQRQLMFLSPYNIQSQRQEPAYDDLYMLSGSSATNSETDSRVPISQINQRILSGGNLIVNTTPQIPKPTENKELAIALQHVEERSHDIENDEREQYFQDLCEYIKEDTTEARCTSDIFGFGPFDPETFGPIPVVPNEEPQVNPIEEFDNSNHLFQYEESAEDPFFLDSLQKNHLDIATPNVFPTPPPSETVHSPLSESQTSFYPSNSDYTLSPERSSPTYNSDYEKYQDISPLSETSERDLASKKPLEQTPSMSQPTMKKFKDLQKEIASEFSKKECCQTNRKPCKAIFQEHLAKMSAVDRKNLCFKVAKLDLDSATAYGLLQNTLLSLAPDSKEEDFHMALFGLICERVLAQEPNLFLDEFGLRLLKSTAMRCPHRPVLTRLAAQCVYAALKQHPNLEGKECVFHEVDLRGDNLVLACARAGDEFAPVLAELCRADARGDLPPLFQLHHTNADGYTALHLACSQHSVDAPRLHTAHVLLEHAQADLWKGDVRGGETSVHLAVNSARCDLRLVVTLFRRLDRKMWKRLAHCHNLGSVTPLEYARIATKSLARENYPTEVLDFLKKCR